MSTAEQTDQLTALWDELGAPSLKNFKFALANRGISLPAAEIGKFVALQSERQIAQPGNRYTGKVVAFYEDDRWAVDIVSYVARPVTVGDKKYQHVLICQDMFTRFLRTAPLTGVMEGVDALDEIFKERTCRSICSDNGTEWRSGKYKDMAARHGVLIEYRDAQDPNGPLSRLDNAIGTFKRKTKALIDRGKGANWFEVMEHATKAYNKDRHGGIGAAPENIPDGVVLEQRQIAAQGAAHNDAQIRRRKAKLEKLGAFRVLLIKRGLKKRRADDSTWSSEIHLVKDFPQAAVVRDMDNKEFATKRVLAVSTESTDLVESTDVTDKLRSYAEDMRELVAEGGERFGRLAEILERARPGFGALLRKEGLNSNEFTAMFPEILTRKGYMVSAT